MTFNRGPWELDFPHGCWRTWLEATRSGFSGTQATAIGKFKARKTFWKGNVLFFSLAGESIYLWICRSDLLQSLCGFRNLIPLSVIFTLQELDFSNPKLGLLYAFVSSSGVLLKEDKKTQQTSPVGPRFSLCQLSFGMDSGFY